MDNINRTKWKEIGEVITLSGQEVKKIKALARPIHDNYLSKLEAKGLQAKVVYKELLNLIDKYNEERLKEIRK